MIQLYVEMGDMEDMEQIKMMDVDKKEVEEKIVDIKKVRLVCMEEEIVENMMV